jgi:hypothetical protein
MKWKILREDGEGAIFGVPNAEVKPRSLAKWRGALTVQCLGWTKKRHSI